MAVVAFYVTLALIAFGVFYANCDGKAQHMDRNRNRHAHHLLSRCDLGGHVTANRLRFSSAPLSPSGRFLSFKVKTILAYSLIYSQFKNSN